ncbi:hypothetical protein EV421DRAFT_1892502 [Armillaria borealis]|uniref:NAD(P)-binding domain-containing protein n=1 Tax=Armillaria borealis TaxID=47425 RepID=A0AA39J401_9AGAR|nr:hypothetical protein EV421DRAFT_1892502 [Armillaria borealis]
MTILLTGGTGKTATRIARLLKDAHQSVLLTSRKDVLPEPFKDPLTLENVITTDPNIDRIYPVAPPATAEKGAKRFVLLTASTMTDGYPLMGLKAHEYLLPLDVDYAVLRPSWFLVFSALTDEKSNNTDHIITGPELLSYDDRFISFGLPEGFTGMLSSSDGLNANVGEEEVFKVPKKVTGKRTLRSFAEANRDRF